MSIDAVDRKIIEATQAGLPLAPQPYHDVARKLGLEPEGVRSRLRRCSRPGSSGGSGLPNHYALD